MSKDLRLRPLRLADELVAIEAHEIVADEIEFLLGYQRGEPWPNYVRRLEDHRRGNGLPIDWVPSTFRVATVDGNLVGRVSIRHTLNDFLARVGGHIGYAVLPGWRRKGCATTMLQQSLVIARSEGVDRVLVTCDDDNEASAKVIERCGGSFESLTEIAEGEPVKRLYWID